MAENTYSPSTDQTLGNWVAYIQQALISITIFISIVAGPRQLFSNIALRPNIPLEWQAITFSIADYFLLFFVAVSILRLVNDDPYRMRLTTTATALLRRGGLPIWIALTVLFTASAAWALVIDMALFTAVHLIFCLMAAVFLADLARDRVDVFLYPLLLSAVIQAVIAILQSINGDALGLYALGEKDPYFYENPDLYRARGLSMHPNYLGGFLMLALFGVSVIYWLRRQREQATYFLWPLAILFLVGIATTLSRSAIISTVLGILVIAALFAQRLDPKQRQRLLIGLGIGAVLFTGAGIVAVGANWDNIEERFFRSREFFFEDSFNLIQEAPLTGVGAGNIMLEVSLDREYEELHLLPVHNVYLFIWAEAGIIAMGLFILGCLYVLSHFRFTGNMTLYTLTAAFLGMCVINLFDNYFWGVHPHRVMFFYMLGLWWAAILALSPAPQQTTSA